MKLRIFSFHHQLRIATTCVILLLSTIFVNTDKGKTMAYTSYSVSQTFNGFRVYYLEQDGKAIAKIAPALGNNCYAFRVTDGERWINLIDPPPDLATLKERPTAFGNPILFPFPNRIRNGKWEFEGNTYQFDKSPESPTTIHGLLLNRPFQVDKTRS